MRGAGAGAEAVEKRTRREILARKRARLVAIRLMAAEKIARKGARLGAIITEIDTIGAEAVTGAETTGMIDIITTEDEATAESEITGTMGAEITEIVIITSKEGGAGISRRKNKVTASRSSSRRKGLKWTLIVLKKAGGSSRRSTRPPRL